MLDKIRYIGILLNKYIKHRMVAVAAVVAVAILAVVRVEVLSMATVVHGLAGTDNHLWTKANRGNHFQ
jgi:hypothetical protein